MLASLLHLCSSVIIPSAECAQDNARKKSMSTLLRQLRIPGPTGNIQGHIFSSLFKQIESSGKHGLES